MKIPASFVAAGVCLLHACLSVGHALPKQHGGLSARQVSLSGPVASATAAAASATATFSPQAQAEAAVAFTKLQSLLNFTNPSAGLTGLFAGIGCDACKGALGVLSVLTPPGIEALGAVLCTLIEASHPDNIGVCTGYINTYAPYLSQILPHVDIPGVDGQTVCFSLLRACPIYVPPVPANAFPKPKPANATAPTPGNQTVNVLHLSDYHLDLRYAVGAEAECDQPVCCRDDYGIFNSPPPIKSPAPKTGAYLCDTPTDLATSTFTSVKQTLTGKDTPAFGIFTGDLVSHDIWMLNESYVTQEELTSYNQFFNGLGDVKIYPVLGNHDSYPHALNNFPAVNTPSLNDYMNYNYIQTSNAWKNYSWLSPAAADYASKHYGSYVTKTASGLKIFALQTDWWYTQNFYNYIDVNNIDRSGQLANLIAELQDSEDKGERVWIIGHVNPGGEGSPQGLPGPTNFFRTIVERYSPHVIAGIFWGHEHTDQASLYYANDGQDQTAAGALNFAWIGPSVTPYTYQNAAWRYYKVDTKTFSIMDSYTYIANISNSGTLTWNNGPIWQFEYSARDVYAPAGYPTTSPLNATFWHAVTERFLKEPALVARYNVLEVKSAPTQNGSTYGAANEGNSTKQVCEIRSGSTQQWLRCQ